METLSPLDQFGKFLMENCRDQGIESSIGLLNNKWKAPILQSMQAELYKLNDKQKEAVQDAFIHIIDVAIHDFLFALQNGYNDDIQIIVDGENVVELSDGIHGEPYSDEGWRAKYSKFKSIE